MIMKGKDAIALTLRFIQKGSFSPLVIPNEGDHQ